MKIDYEMKPDYLPSIKAYLEQRMESVQKNNGMEAIEKAARIEELRSVWGLCIAFANQQHLIEGLFNAVPNALRYYENIN